MPRLIFIVSVLAAGAAAGSIYGIKSPDIGSGFFGMLENNGADLFRWLCMVNISFVLMLFICSHFSAGAVPVIGVLAANGFVFSAPVTANIRAQGMQGYFGFAGAGSLSCLLSVFAVVAMAMQSMEMISCRKMGVNKWQSREEDTKNTLVIFMAGAAAIVFGSAVDAYLLK